MCPPLFCGACLAKGEAPLSAAPGRISPLPRATQPQFVFTILLGLRWPKNASQQHLPATCLQKCTRLLHSSSRCCARCCRNKALKADDDPNLNRPSGPETQERGFPRSRRKPLAGVRAEHRSPEAQPTLWSQDCLLFCLPVH